MIQKMILKTNRMLPKMTRMVRKMIKMLPITVMPVEMTRRIRSRIRMKLRMKIRTLQIHRITQKRMITEILATKIL